MGKVLRMVVPFAMCPNRLVHAAVVAGLALVSLALLPSPAHAITIPSTGGSGAPDVLPAYTYTTGPVADTGVLPFTAKDGLGNVTIIGTYEELAVADQTNVFCAGCIDFVISVSNNANSADAIARITAANFAGFKTDIGYIEGSGSPNVVPATVDRGSTGGGVVGFNFPSPSGSVAPGNGTANLIIETDATQFRAGTLAIIDAGTADVDAFAPVPEPNSILLLGTGLLGMVGMRRARG